MYKFNWQYKNCHIPMISAASLRQDKVLGRGGTHGWGRGDIASLDVFYFWKILSLIFIFPNDMPDTYIYVLPAIKAVSYFNYMFVSSSLFLFNRGCIVLA